MISRGTFGATATAGSVAVLMPGVARAKEGPRTQNIVLVHGLFAEAHLGPR